MGGFPTSAVFGEHRFPEVLDGGLPALCGGDVRLGVNRGGGDREAEGKDVSERLDPFPLDDGARDIEIGAGPKRGVGFGVEGAGGGESEG